MMTDADMRDYQKEVDSVNIARQRAIERMDTGSPYDDMGGVNVIDTDYDNFLILYSCHQFEDEEGQEDGWQHVEQVTLYARTADIPASQADSLIEKMASYFPTQDFSQTHKKLDHEGCPAGDFFKSAMSFDKLSELEEVYEEVYWEKMREMGDFYQQMKEQYPDMDWDEQLAE